MTTSDTNIQDPDGIDQIMTEGLSGYGCLPEIKVANLGIEDESIHHDKGKYFQQDMLSNVEKLEGKALCESDSIDVDGKYTYGSTSLKGMFSCTYLQIYRSSSCK